MVKRGRKVNPPVQLYLRVLAILLIVELFTELVGTELLEFVGFEPTHWSHYFLKSLLMMLLAIPLIYYWVLRQALRLRDAEHRVRQSEQRYRSLFEHNPNGVYTVGVDGLLLMVNDAFTQMLGRSRQEVMSTSIEEFVDEADIRRVRSYFRKSIRGSVQTYEASLRHVSGQKIRVIVTFVPMFIQGKVNGIHAVVQDVTLRRSAEQALRLTTEQLEAFIKYNNDAIVIFTDDLIVQRVNPAFEMMYGWTAAEIVGQRLPFIPLERQPEVDLIVETLREGMPVTSFETSRIRKDGRSFIVSLTVSPIRDAQGEITAFSAVSRDITAQKQAQEQLRAATELMESVIHQTTDAIIVQDLDGRILQVNPAFVNMFGWHSDDLVGRFAIPVIETEESGYHVHRHRVLAGQTVRDFETIGRRKDGSDIDLSVSMSPIRDSDNRVVGISAIARDTTERKRAEDLVLKSEKLRVAGELAAGIAHELRNPMTAVSGFLQMMRPQLQGHEAHLQIVENELKSMDRILGELLILAKPKMHQVHPERIDELLQSTVNFMQTHAHLLNVEIVNHASSESATVMCDKGQIKQVLVNVLKNAVESMPQGGTIEVESEKCEESVTIYIRDQGEGISADVLAKIGDPFYTTKDQGTGLGLSICRRILENHAGTLHISSEVGHGTTVEVTLPLVPISQVL